MSAIKIMIGYGDGRTEERTLPVGSYQIGREVGDIVLYDPNLSGQHALLVVAAGSVTVTDQGSTNGTYDAAGRRLSAPLALRAGESVRLGASSITLLPSAQRGGTQVMPQFAPVPAAPQAAGYAPQAGGYAPPGTGYAPPLAPPTAAYTAPPLASAPARAPATRGTLIKAPDASPGLIMVNGQQRPFVLEGVWRIPAAPTPGMSVEVAFDPQGNIVALTPVDTAQLALEQGQQVAELARKGYGVALDRMGKVPLIAGVVLWFGWFVLPSVKFGPMSLTFWDLLGVDSSSMLSLAGGTSNHGFLAFLGLIAIALPFAPLVWKGPSRPWLNVAPLAFLTLMAVSTVIAVEHQISQSEQSAAAMQTSLFGASSNNQFAQAANNQFAQAAKAAQDAASDALIKGMIDAIGFGLWVVLIASLVLCVQAFMRRRSTVAQPAAQPALSAAH